MEFLVVVGLLVLGAMMGSFACCQAWRLRARGRKKLPARSQCMKCGHKLAWWENVPVFSWLFLRGKCRKCGKKIGAAEILMEIGGALAFLGCFVGEVGLGGAADGWIWARFVLLLLLLVVLGVLAVYDGKWGELPTALLFVAVVLGAAAMLLREIPLMIAGVDMRGEFVSILMALLMLAGLYLVLSKLKLAGDGDWLLGLAVGLALADWWLALLVLAGSNLLAVIFAMFAGKRRIYFGPFLVLAFVVVISLEKVLCLQCLI